MDRLTFGTFKLQGESLKLAIKQAESVGFTRFDTAQLYQNEEDVGRLAAGHEITSKIRRICNYSKMMAEIKKSLNRCPSIHRMFAPSPNARSVMEGPRRSL